MRAVYVFFIIMLVSFTGKAQEAEVKRNNKETKEKELALRMEHIQNMLESRDFVFNATDMYPRGLGVVNLGYDCDVQIKDNQMICYLPFMGKTYDLTYRGGSSGFDFTQPIKDYQLEKTKKGFEVKIEVRNENDVLNFRFRITKKGLSSLTVSSLNRQSISYSGTIDPIK